MNGVTYIDYDDSTAPITRTRNPGFIIISDTTDNLIPAVEQWSDEAPAAGSSLLLLDHTGGF